MNSDEDSRDDHPLVSIMMPCYNSRETLPWAISSVLAQTYDNWELIVVDDGSTDNPEVVVEQAADERIRLVRLPENMGRGYARQVALDNVTGEFICMLDADDWMYPDRIKHQLGVFRQHPEVVLVSSGMAITDLSREIVGVRATGSNQVSDPVETYDCPVAHAPSMLKREGVIGIRYNPRFDLGQDVDFLARVLLGRRYVALDQPLYVYEEHYSWTARKSFQALRYQRLGVRLNSERPFDRWRGIASTYVKQGVYAVASILGADSLLLHRRNRAPTSEESTDFSRARELVDKVVDERFGVHTVDSSGERLAVASTN